VLWLTLRLKVEGLRHFAFIGQEIRENFGDVVVSIVNGCTDAEVIPKPPWQARKQAYIEKMRHASSQVRRVSMADKLHNARSILADYHRGDKDVWHKFTGGKEGTLWYFRSLIELNRQAGTNYLTEECDRIVRQLEEI
jgi:(p)ppGpp synthase/HD superfamily hydrolase